MEIEDAAWGVCSLRSYRYVQMDAFCCHDGNNGEPPTSKILLHLYSIGSFLDEVNAWIGKARTEFPG